MSISDIDIKIKDLDQEIRRLKREKALQEQEAETERLRVLRPVAIAAHRVFCPFNHTDACSWGYEYTDQFGTESIENPFFENTVPPEGSAVTQGAHVRWLLKVDRICQNHPPLSPSELLLLISEVEKLKELTPPGKFFDIVSSLTTWR